MRAIMMQAQARICPICIDDHLETSECTVENLKYRVAQLQKEKRNSPLELAMRSLSELYSSFRSINKEYKNYDLCLDLYKKQEQVLLFLIKSFLNKKWVDDVRIERSPSSGR